MTRRPLVIGAVLLLLGLPAVLVAIDAASSYAVARAHRSLISSGVKREYLLYVPKSYDRARPTPLVISMHGAKNWPSVQMHLTRWNQAADEHGFIVVYPGGNGAGPKTWFMRGADEPSRMPDVVFISELIDTLEAAYNIDPARIYANGISNGAGMAFVLSCTLSHRIAAIGAVAAAQLLPWTWCADTRPVPIIAFHGTGDRVTPYEGGKVWIAPKPFPGVPEWAASWARRNRCGPSPIDSTVAPDVARVEYTNCAGGAAVVLYTIKEGGHTWPGGPPMADWLLGPTTRSIDATREMWAFFHAHPLRRP